MKKLAELNVDEMTLLMCRVAEPAGNLFADGAVIAAFVDVAKVLQEANFRLAGIAYFASKIIPVLLGDAHKEDTLAILAAFDGRPVDELRKQNGLKTMKGLYQIFMEDQDAINFFRPDEEVQAE